jgi:ATP/maltotriose-dependent transcriptional regulator MalT
MPPAEIAELHRRAAAWLATQGLLEEAIPHALAGDGGAAAGQLLARHRNLLLNREQRIVSTAVCGCCRPILSRAIPNCCC